MAEQQERLGQQVGEYRLLQERGRGTFGTVYQAEHLHDHSHAAIKLLRLQLTNREDLKDFLNEARTMMRMRHPHIIPLLDFGLSHEDTPYLAMEFAGGGTLRQRHPKGTKLPLETIDTYITQLASALQYAHDHRVIHRDVKPENILLRTDGTILLSDFGIAKVLEQSSFVSLQTQVGTPAYMAPEQSWGKPCPASDQYALAVIVYEWIAGQLPFQGAPLEVMLQHRIDEPPSLQNLCPEMPIQVEQVVLQALAKTPEERFSTVEHFSQALHTALRASSPTVAPEPLSGFPHLSEMSSAPPDKIPTLLPLQLAHSVKTQATLGSDQEESGTNTSRYLGKYDIKNDGPIRTLAVGDSAQVTVHSGNTQEEDKGGSGNQPAPPRMSLAFYFQSASVLLLLCLILWISFATPPQRPLPVTPTASNIPTTPQVTATSIPQVTATSIPQVTATSIPQVTDTSTPQVTATSIPQVTATSIPQVTATSIPQVTATSIPQVTATSIPQVTATSTPQVTATSIPQVTATANTKPQ